MTTILVLFLALPSCYLDDATKYHLQCRINHSGGLCQHEMGGPSNPLPSPSLPLSFPSPPPFPSHPLEVGPLKYS